MPAFAKIGLSKLVMQGFWFVILLAVLFRPFIGVIRTASRITNQKPSWPTWTSRSWRRPACSSRTGRDARRTDRPRRPRDRRQRQDQRVAGGFRFAQRTPGAAGRAPPGREHRHQEDVERVQRQHDAGNEGAFVHVADRAAELVGHHDQRQRRQLRQRAGRRDDAGGDAAVVAVARRDRQRDRPTRRPRRWWRRAGRRRTPPHPQCRRRYKPNNCPIV